MDPTTLKHLELPTPVFILGGEVTESMLSKMKEAFAFLMAKGSPDFELIIDSGGGSTSAGLDIFDILRLYKGKVTGKVISKAASMAAIILQACHVRQCAQHAEILIHHVSRKNVSLDMLTSSKRLKNLIADMKRPQERIYKILLDRTKQTRRSIVLECKKDTFMSAERALELGLIDMII